MALIAGFDIAEPSAVWADLGFTLQDGIVWVDQVAFRLGGRGAPITRWSLWGVRGDADGLPTTLVDEVDPQPTPDHPNGVTGLDHVVVSTPDHGRTVAAFEAAGLRVLRVRETEKIRQAFFRLGPVILELVGGHTPRGDGPAAFLGFAWTVRDLDVTAGFFGPRLHAAKDAVQPGQQIATLDAGAGSAIAMAFMSPQPAR